MAGIIGPSALAFGVMSEIRLAIFAVSALGFVAAVLIGFGSSSGSPTSGMWTRRRKPR
jgi:hypothetical protein